MQKSLIYDNGTLKIDLVTDLECRLTDIQGVSPYSTVNSSSISGFDGSTYISDQVEKRSITIMIAFLSTGDCEAVVHRLYNVFQIKKEGVLHYVSESRDLKINCRVLSAECPHNAVPLKMQVQLECDDPYFYSEEVVSYMATTVGAFEFPFEVWDFSLIHNGNFIDGLNCWDIDTKFFEIVDQSQYTGGTATTLKINSKTDTILKQVLNIAGVSVGEQINIAVATTIYFVFSNPTVIKLCGYTNEVRTEYSINTFEYNIMVSQAYVIATAPMLAEDRLMLEISGIHSGNTIANITATCGGTLEFGIMSDSLIAQVQNNGEISTGSVFVLTAMGACLNPKIQNINTFEWIQVNLAMVAGDKLIINTKMGQKSISFIHDGVTANYINHKVYGSSFLQLAVGVNEFRYSASENESNLQIACIFSAKYGGV